jgi:hypothetical protein
LPPRAAAPAGETPAAPDGLTYEQPPLPVSPTAPPHAERRPADDQPGRQNVHESQDRAAVRPKAPAGLGKTPYAVVPVANLRKPVAMPRVPADVGAADPEVKPASALVTPIEPVVRQSAPPVSTGVILWEVTESSTPSTPDARLGALEAHFRQEIASACKMDVDNVEVSALPGNKLCVRVRALSAAEAEALSARIFGLPELGPYQVSLDIPVVP